MVLMHPGVVGERGKRGGGRPVGGSQGGPVCLYQRDDGGRVGGEGGVDEGLEGAGVEMSA